MIDEKILTILLTKADLGEITGVRSIHSGLINKTMKVMTTKGSFAIQQINDLVFESPKLIGENEILLYEFCPELLVQLIAPEKSSLWKHDNQFYRITKWEEELISHNLICTIEMAVSAAELLGKFHLETRHVKSSLLQVIIPKFHDLNHRYKKFNEACILTELKDDKLNELISGLRSFSFLIGDYNEMTATEKIIVCHNDLKISNMLFDERGEAVKIIDLDTLMPGYACTDFGDLVRSVSVNCGESELQISQVKFDHQYMEAMLSAYRNLTNISDEYLLKGVLFIFYIMSLRFATDYLLGNKYYSINFPEENYIRARNQYILLGQANQFILNHKI